MLRQLSRIAISNCDLEQMPLGSAQASLGSAQAPQGSVQALFGSVQAGAKDQGTKDQGTKDQGTMILSKRNAMPTLRYAMILLKMGGNLHL